MTTTVQPLRRMALINFSHAEARPVAPVTCRRLRQVALHQRAIQQLGFCSVAWPRAVDEDDGRKLALAVIRAVGERFGVEVEVIND